MAGKSEKSAGNGAGKAAKTRSTRATTARKTTAARRKANVVTHDAIALRAYEIFEAGKGGTDVEHWLQAEHELRV
jgi:Protein of unknown function (DUF2934)